MEEDWLLEPGRDYCDFAGKFNYIIYNTYIHMYAWPRGICVKDFALQLLPAITICAAAATSRIRTVACNN